MKFFAALLFWLGAFLIDCNAQDTLPAFSVVNRNGKIILSWVNHFPVVKQMSIQRSFDSAKGFKTILTLPDPTSVTNGFLDNNAPDTTLFYKLYILLDSGKYMFSKVKRPEKKLAQVAAVKPPAPQTNDANPAKDLPRQVANTPTKPIVNTNAPTATNAVPDKKLPGNTNPVAAAVQKPADNKVEAPAPVADEPPSKKYAVETTQAAAKKRSDGLKSDSTTVTKPEVYKPSSFIFTNTDGNVTMVLPAGKAPEFSIKFFEEKGEMVFEMKSIKENIVILDKSNFLHSGWFRFELYENGVLKEKNRILIPRDAGMR